MKRAILMVLAMAVILGCGGEGSHKPRSFSEWCEQEHGGGSATEVCNPDDYCIEEHGPEYCYPAEQDGTYVCYGRGCD